MWTVTWYLSLGSGRGGRGGGSQGRHAKHIPCRAACNSLWNVGRMRSETYKVSK
jgi:hypothetical protein